MPVYAPRFSSGRTTEFGTEMTSYIEGIRLMRVEIEVIKMITTGVIPKMSEEERSKLMTDLEEINELREQESHCALDISKSLYDHFYFYTH